jgi:hypothetical protein
MDRLLIVVIVSFLWGHIASYCTRYLLSTETYQSSYAIRFFTIPILQTICAIVEILIYLHHGISPYFFFYSVFASVLLIITCTDIFEETIDDRAILLGILSTLLFQIYFGQAIFSLLGGAFAFLITFSVYIFGNHYFSISNVQTEEGETNPEDSQTCIRFALVPSLSVAVIVHALLPEGLASFLYGVLLYIQSHALVLIIVVAFAIVLLIWAMHRRTFFSPLIPEDSKEEDGTITAFGDGDITTSVFLGTVLGMENFVAVFWLGMVVHSIIGITLRIKQRGCLKWI